MSNVLKHSKATEFNVELNVKSEQIHLLCSDNGLGFDQDQVGVESHGFIALRERVFGLGGGLHVNSQPGEGTIVTVDLPVTPQS